MTTRLGMALAFSAALGAAGMVMVAGAQAQQAAPPAAGGPAATAPTDAPNAPAGRRADRGNGMTAQDRMAFFDARLAAVKAGLELTPDQQSLWTPVESAIRDTVTAAQAARQTRMTQARPTDPIETLQRAAAQATARGATLQKLADASRPLYDSLTPAQKHRLPVLMRGMRFMGMGMMGRGGQWRQHMAMMRRWQDGQGATGSRDSSRRSMEDGATNPVPSDNGAMDNDNSNNGGRHRGYQQ